MIKAKIVYKSGTVIDVEVEYIETTCNGLGELRELEWKPIKGKWRPLDIVLGEVAGVFICDVPEEGKSE